MKRADTNVGSFMRIWFAMFHRFRSYAKIVPIRITLLPVNGSFFCLLRSKCWVITGHFDKELTWRTIQWFWSVFVIGTIQSKRTLLWTEKFQRSDPSCLHWVYDFEFTKYLKGSSYVPSIRMGKRNTLFKGKVNEGRGVIRARHSTHNDSFDWRSRWQNPQKRGISSSYSNDQMLGYKDKLPIWWEQLLHKKNSYTKNNTCVRKVKSGPNKLPPMQNNKINDSSIQKAVNNIWNTPYKN